MKIITVPHKSLRQKSLEVNTITPKILKFIKDFEHTLIYKDNPPGVGLSAIQVNEPLRLFTIYLPENHTKNTSPSSKQPFIITTYINPEIIDQSDQLTIGDNPKKPIMEGCLSIPNIYGPVLRHQWIKLKWITPNNQEKSEIFYGFTARVIQHEYDHLDGILFTDRSLSQNQPIYEEKDGEFHPLKLQ